MAQTAQHNFQPVTDFARKLFLEDPGMSIDAAAREIDHKFGTSLVKNEISRIRTSVREQIEASHTKPGQNIVPLRRRAGGAPVSARRPFNPPHFSKKKHEEEKPMPATTTATTHTATPPPSTKKERADFLSEWALKNPHARIEDARAALKRRFGMALQTKYIATTLKIAREVAQHENENPVPAMAQIAAGTQVKPGLPNPLAIAEIVRNALAAGIRRLEINPDGSYSLDLWGKLEPSAAH